MPKPPAVMVVHPHARQRILLRSVLEDHGRSVMTEQSCAELLAEPPREAPAVLLLDRSYVGSEGAELLTLLRQKWPDTEILILPEELEVSDTWRDTVIQLLRHIDRLTSMHPAP